MNETAWARFDAWFVLLIRVVGMGILLLGVGYGLYVFGWQIYIYMRTDIWGSIGLLDFLGSELGWAWAEHPTDWIGLHKILNLPNAGVSIMLISGLVGIQVSSIKQI